MTLADLVYIDDTGYHYADYPAFLQYEIDLYRSIYGADSYLEADSQDGQRLAVQARALYDTAALGASIYNSFSPISAQGTGLSRNVKINGLNRREATKSSVDITIVGVTGTMITNGVVIDTLEQKWDVPSPTLIPDAGTITVTATAQVAGAVQAAANTVNRIFTPTLGWQTVDNATAASAGAAVETDGELRLRQAISTANPSLTVFDGTVGAVANLDGVTAVRGYENDTASTDANGIPEHSICLVVEGGVVLDIAQTIALHKTPGTGTFGTTAQLVYDSHGMPLTIRFSRPEVVSIKAEITISANEGYSSDYEALIQESVAAAINKFGIGSLILITRLFQAAYLNGAEAGDTYDITTLEIAANADPLGTANIQLDYDQIPLCIAASDVVVVVT